MNAWAMNVDRSSVKRPQRNRTARKRHVKKSQRQGHVPAEQRGLYTASAFKWLRPRSGLGFQIVVQRLGCKRRAPTAEAWPHPEVRSGILRAVEPGLQLVGRFSLGQLLRSRGFSNGSRSHPAIAKRSEAAPSVPGQAFAKTAEDHNDG